MGKFLERFGSSGAAAILIWSAWSGLEDPAASALIQKQEEKVDLPKVSREFLVVRPRGDRVLLERDPFDAAWASALGIVAPAEAAPEPGRAAEAAESAETGAEDESEPVSLSLSLESVLELPGTRQARLSGMTVREGDPIPGIDPAHPPLLLRVRGTGVTVSYRDRLFQLDLWNRPRIGDAASASAPPSARSASSSPASPRGVKRSGLIPRSGSKR